MQNWSGVPAGVQSDLRALSQVHARQVLRLCGELAAILRKFNDCGIEVLPQKGPVLGQILFGDPAMRQFGDLDLLIRKKDVPPARKALQELGYRPKLQLSDRQEQAYLHSGYEYAFGSDAGANLVELQWQILPRFYSISFDTDSLFTRGVEIDFEGTRTRVLGNEDLMLVLCVHAAKHEWSQLGMVRDIATLSRFDLDWDRIGHEARRLGIFRILAISLLLARDLLGCEVPIDSGLSEDFDTSRKLARVFQSTLKSLHENDTQSLAYFRRMMRIRERWRDRARLAWRLAVTPDVGEWKSVDIPDGLFPLYHAVRAFRLIRRFSCTLD